NNALWAAVCRVLGHPEWTDDERFATPSHRARHQDQLRVMLETIFADEPAPFWLKQFRAAGVPCAPINNYSDVLADPQVEHMQWVQPLTLPNGVETRTFGSPINLSGYGLPISPHAMQWRNNDGPAPNREKRAILDVHVEPSRQNECVELAACRSAVAGRGRRACEWRPNARISGRGKELQCGLRSG